MMREETGDTPLLLLDDVMSELDATRRQACSPRWRRSIRRWSRRPTGVTSRRSCWRSARRWRVEQGTLQAE